MAKPKSIHECRTNRDFERVITRQGGQFESGKGSHVKVTNPNKAGCAIYSDHGGTHEYPTGTLKSIIRMLAAIGFMMFVAFVVLYAAALVV